MFIKQVKIEGFRSFRDMTITEPFCRGHNIIVGKNGSGKSNFMRAIQFVLSEEFRHLRPEHHTSFFHEGTGPRVLNAYVEITFDNSEKRFPTDGQEFSLRRVIGTNKDQYYLENKPITRVDVKNMLECAGVVKSDSYYYIKQGMINQCASASNTYRLQLLKEVAGASYYYEKKEERDNLIRESQRKLDGVGVMLEELEEMLRNLEIDNEEYKEFEKLDKRRRSIIYVIYEQVIRDTKEEQKELKTRQGRNSCLTEELRINIQETSEIIEKINEDLIKAKQDIEALKRDQNGYNRDYNSLLREKVMLELIINDLKDEVGTDDSSRERTQLQLEELQQAINAKSTELENIKTEYEKQKKNEEECTKELGLKEQKRNGLYAKQKRASQFTSKEERDEWVKKELNKLKKHKNETIEQIRKLREGGVEKISLSKSRDELSTKMEQQKDLIDKRSKDFDQKKKEKNTLHVEKNKLWREENSMHQNLATLKEDLSRKERSMRFMMGKERYDGRASLNKVLKIFNDRGGEYAEIARKYYGMLLQNFTCDKTNNTAVEITSGARLFYHVVESDNVATKILNEKKSQKLTGEVTFIAINRLVYRDVNYPSYDDTVTMISQLKFVSNLEPVMKFIFGRTLICRDLEVATLTARTAELECVTYDGDQFSRKRGLTGGYRNPNHSPIQVYQDYEKLLKNVSSKEAALRDCKCKIAELETKINRISSDMLNIETTNLKNKDVYEKYKADMHLLKENINSLDHDIPTKERRLMDLEVSLKSMESTVESLNREKNEEISNELSVTDQQEILILNDQIKNLKQNVKDTSSQKMNLKRKLNLLQHLLNNNLYRKKEELKAVLQEICVENREQKLIDSENTLTNLLRALSGLKKNVDDTDAKIEALTNDTNTITQNLEQQQTKKTEFHERIDELSRDLEGMDNIQMQLSGKIMEFTNKRSRMGFLPPYINEYQNYTIPQLMEFIRKIYTDLGKFKSVHMIDAEDLNDQKRDTEDIRKRKEEADRAQEAVVDLVNCLERKKNEIMELTFKQIAKSFSDFFTRLVPQGHASLIMIANNKEITEQAMEARAATPESSIMDIIDGVGIRASFTGREKEMVDMKQLSGGQQSLISLALIFAIQKTDPAPFFFFDEIDRHLDTNNRKAVAEIIREMSILSQVFSITFKPELFEYADKFYICKFVNKASHIEAITDDEAKEFLQS